MLGVIREVFGPLLDGTDVPLLAVVGGTGVGRVTVTPEGVPPGTCMEPLRVASVNTLDHRFQRDDPMSSNPRSTRFVAMSPTPCGVLSHRQAVSATY